MCHTGKLLEREMKMTTARILASLLLVFVSLASAADIRNYHSGSWYDPDHSGHGISVEVVDPRTLCPLDEEGIIESVKKTHRLVIVHDDEEREYVVTAAAEKLLAAGEEGGWTMVSMKNDWKRVFSWEPTEN